MSREVTLVGPLKTGDGVMHQKGDKVTLEDTDADWYTNSVLDQRRTDMDQPMVAAIAAVAMPADATAHPKVETSVSSDERDMLRAGAAAEIAVGARTIVPVGAEGKPPATATPATAAARASANEKAQHDQQDQATKRG